MKILFTDKFIKQYSIVRMGAINKNPDFIVLFEKINLCLGLIYKAETDNDLPFLRWHKGAKKVGYLAYPNDNCISIDMDGEHRLDAYRLDDKAIVISSIGHHEFLKQLKLFKDLDFVVKEIKDLKDQNKISQLYTDNLRFKQLVSASVSMLKKDLDINSCKAIFEKDFYTNLCPSSPNVYIHNLKKHIKTSKEGINSTIKNFIGKNHDFLERTIVNARCFNNIASVVCGNGDLKETALLKLELQDNLYDNIAKVFKYVKNSNISDENKDVIFKNLKDTVLKAFDVGHDGIIYGSNEASPEYVLAKAIDKSFYGNIYKDLKKASINRIRKELLFEFSNKDISDKIIRVKNGSSENFSVFAKNLWNNFLPSKLWNTFFTSKKNKAKNSATPENKNVKQEENIIKTETEKNVKEAQTVDKVNDNKEKNSEGFQFMHAKSEKKSRTEGSSVYQENEQKSERIKVMEENITKKETIAESQENQSLNNQEQSLSLKRREHMNKQIQIKAEASKEVNKETQNSDRMKMMQRNQERNNARENVISTSQKKGKSR
ncbi:hypothetical protein [Ruminobacter sp. RM87]|uniref:hypothetical protein n=1 Tax=Ruminobacter sp. RM87 TaxID=1200567 RepID=UPI0004E0B7DB|nr:hypothetical protein [Ruminobacter sp. RM87]